MYYKSIKNKPYYEPSKDIILKDGLVEITKEEFEQLIIDINTPTAVQILEQEINKAKQYLADTDHKFYNGYKPKVDEDLVAIELERDTAREFIRANKGAI